MRKVLKHLCAGGSVVGRSARRSRSNIQYQLRCFGYVVLPRALSGSFGFR